MSGSDPVVICSYARTPMGSFQGALSSMTAPQLGAVAVRSAVDRAGVHAENIEKIVMGCVLAAGLGQAPARQVALGAHLGLRVEAVTVNKMCGSGLQAVILAHDAIVAGSANVVVAGGMEAMTQAPYLMQKHRGGARIGHDNIIDSMMRDGLEDAYCVGKSMGEFAQEAAVKFGFLREAMDRFAIESLDRARSAIEVGAFADEIVPVQLAVRGGVTLMSHDEQPAKADPEKIPHLKPAFVANGSITAANASSISDGAAALVLARESVARAQGLPVLARIVAHAGYADEPGEFVTAPVPAMEKALAKAGWKASDVDLWEINEAFAVVAMFAQRELGIERGRLNVHGGATALGHPIGASGARILVTLLSALRASGGKRGIASLCIGGGEAVAVAVEVI